MDLGWVGMTKVWSEKVRTSRWTSRWTSSMTTGGTIGGASGSTAPLNKTCAYVQSLLEALKNNLEIKVR